MKEGRRGKMKHNSNWFKCKAEDCEQDVWARKPKLCESCSYKKYRKDKRKIKFKKQEV